MKQITPQEFLNLYEDRLLEDPIAIGNKVYGRTTKGQANNPKQYEVVYCVVQ